MDDPVQEVDQPPAPLQLSPLDACANTDTIEALVQAGGWAVIPKGSWPVRPIGMGSGSRITGLGRGVSELRLEIDSPGRFDPQHVIATVVQDEPGQFTTDVHISKLTIHGNYKQIDWRDIHNDGNAFGIYLRGAAQARVSDIEIRDCWTDGIFVSTVLGHANNTKDSTFNDVVIHHCGRQGVSVVGGENLTFRKFQVHSIGRDAPLGTSPRSAIDLEPEPGVQRLVRNIEIRDWDIRRVGQGILVSGGGSAEPAEKIVIQDVKIADLDGVQILGVRDVKDVTVRNVSANNLHPPRGGVGVLFRNTSGQVERLAIGDLRNTNYPFRIDGASDLRLQHVTVQKAERGVLQIGNEPNRPRELTTVQLSDFLFSQAGLTPTALPLARVASGGQVTMTRGTIISPGRTTFTMQLHSDARFFDCRFAPGRFGLFDPATAGGASGRGNNW